MLHIAIVHDTYSRRGNTPLDDAIFHKKKAAKGSFDYESLRRVIYILNKHGQNSRDNDADLAPSISGRLIKRKIRKMV